MAEVTICSDSGVQKNKVSHCFHCFPVYWCFLTVVLGNTLESPLDCKEINQSILKTSPGCSLEGLMLKLKLQYFGHLVRRTDSLEKTLMLRNIKGGRRRGQQRMRWLDGITDLMDMNLSNSGSWWWTGKSGVLQSMASQRVRHDWATELVLSEVHENWSLRNRMSKKG